MICPKCQNENAESSKFCAECGYLLAPISKATPRVPSFDEKLDKIQRYLPKGLTEKILAQRGKIEGERKQVTVMFCDMEGFTSMTEKFGPEEAYSFMDRVYEILIRKVHEYEGTVNEMTGDGILALFGVPIALEDAPQRALRSALSIHNEIDNFNETQKNIAPIKMRVGIHTGPVIMGSLGNDLRVEFKAVGDTVNLASRMEGLAEPGTTYVTEDTFKLTEGLFRFKDLGKRKIKGKKEAVPVYKLLSAKKSVYRPRLGMERIIYSDMVGRDKELYKLELQVLKAINGEGSIVNIIGEAGIGKSRLLAELRKLEVIKRVSMFEGRAISTGQNLSFYPIIDLVKHWARIGEDDNRATAISKLEIAIGRVCPKEIDEILPFVATLMGMKLSGRYYERIKGIEGEALEKLMQKVVRDLLIKASARRTLVIVAEDLHWSDASTIEFMESLFRLVETQRIVFINVFRPDYLETSDRIVKIIRERLPVYYTEIVLGPLEDRTSETLINNMLKIKSLPRSVRDQIIERAAGNPFFIEEVVRSFIDDGIVVLKDEGFEVTDKIETVIIPQTINDVLMSRIDRLEDKTRNLIKVASVIGRNFFYKILVDVANTVDDMDYRLSYLKEIQLIKERKRMEELEYLFKHALAQEAAYQSILNQKRMDLHLKVADSIENVFREKLPEFYGMLAYHYSQGENLDKAEEYLIKAGKEALRAAASTEALHYYQQGLKLYLKKYKTATDLEKLAKFEKNIALAFFNKGHYENALKYYDVVLVRWGEKSPKSKIITCARLIYYLLNVIANLFLPIGKGRRAPSKKINEIFDLSYKRAIILVYSDHNRCFFETLRIMKELNKFDITKVENGVGMWMSASGIFSWAGIFPNLSKKILDYAAKVIDKENNKELLYYNFFKLLYNYLYGNWSDIKEYDEKLIDANLRIGEFWHTSNYITFHGYIKVDQGAFKEVEKIISRLSEIYKVYNNEYARHCQYSLKIKLLIKIRKLYEAQIEADEGFLFMSQTGKEIDILYYFGLRALIQILLKDINGAKELLLQANELVSKKTRIPPYYISSYLLAQFLFDLYLLEESVLSDNKLNISECRKNACQSGKNALRNSQKYAPDKTEIFRLVGRYYWLNGNQHKAVRWWNSSIREGERVKAQVECARSYLEISKRLIEEKSRIHELNGARADDYLLKARAHFEGLDLQLDLNDSFLASD